MHYDRAEKINRHVYTFNRSVKWMKNG
jgi:hypothetical protein